MKYYPIYVDLRQRSCLVLGNGALAAQKAASLHAAGAQVTVIAPNPDPDLVDLAADGQLRLVERVYATEDLAGCALVIDASEDPDLGPRVSADAQARGIWVNIVDQTHLCSFIAPAIVQRGDLVISVSTSGASPAMAKRIRADLERVFGDEYAVALDLLRRLRRRLNAAGTPAVRRKAIFERLAASPLCRYLRDGREGDADRLLERHAGRGVSIASLAATEPGETP